MRKVNQFIANLDWVVILIMATLAFMGWFSVYSAAFDADHPNMYDFSMSYGKQLMWIGVSTFLVIFILNVDGEFFKQTSPMIYGGVLLLLILVLIFGKEAGGAKSWFGFGSIGIQPSEFAKFASALLLASYLDSIKGSFRLFRNRLIAVAILAVPAGLIMLQPDAGTVLVFSGMVFALYREGLSGNILIIGILSVLLTVIAILSGSSTVIYPIYGEASGIFSMIIGIIIVGILALLLVRLLVLPRYRKARMRMISFALLAMIAFSSAVNFAVENGLRPHQRTRIYVTLGIDVEDSYADYNIRHSKSAIGSGSWTGKGYMNGPMTQYGFVPEQHTDFIFCTIGEEWGFLGSSLVVILFFILIFKIVAIAERQRSDFSRVYGYCVASILFMHVLINVGMVMGLAPVIGIPLPFFSYGGSSLMAFSIMIAVLLRLDSERISVFR